MANVTAVAQIYDNSGNAIAASQLGANNYKHVINQADVGRELIVKIAKTNMTDAEVGAYIAYITTSHGSAGAGDSAFVVAAVGTADGSAFVSGTTETVYMRVQGTGNLTLADADTGIANVTVAKVAEFKPAL